MTKENINNVDNAELLGNLIFEIIPICEEKEISIADKHGLLQAELKCLRSFGVDESLNNMDIAERMNLSPSRLSRIMDGLVKKECIIREINKSDRRHMKLSLSRKGKILANKLNDEFVDVHAEILKGIDISEHESLIERMENLNTAVEKWLQKKKLSFGKSM